MYFNLAVDKSIEFCFLLDNDVRYIAYELICFIGDFPYNSTSHIIRIEMSYQLKTNAPSKILDT